MQKTGRDSGNSLRPTLRVEYCIDYLTTESRAYVTAVRAIKSSKDFYRSASVPRLRSCCDHVCLLVGSLRLLLFLENYKSDFHEIWHR